MPKYSIAPHPKNPGRWWYFEKDGEAITREDFHAFQIEAVHALNNLEQLRATLDAVGRYLIANPPGSEGDSASEQEILARIDQSLLDSKA